jgi:CDP-diacylglycerol--glycerol-3-phosphate 3-phosphatidyltransferase
VKKVPNLLSAFRICLVPIFIFVYFTETGEVKAYAVAIYCLAGVTDFLDGYLARRFALTSNLGKVLDPLGDKLMMVSALTCITIDGIIPPYAVAIAFTKEAVMGLGGLVLHRRVREIPPSNIVGKASTVVFIAVCGALMLFRAIPPRAAELMIAGALTLMFAALVSYIFTFARALRDNNP